MTSQPNLNELPLGWISPIDSKTNKHYYVDTRATPPRIIWTHPYLDEEYLKANPISAREGAHQKLGLRRGSRSSSLSLPQPQPPQQQQPHPLPAPSQAIIDDASSARPSFHSSQSYPISSPVSSNNRLSFSADSSSARSVPLPPKKRVLRKRRSKSRDVNSTIPPPQPEPVSVQRWAKEELPYQITPFVPPPRTNQRDVRYSLPTSPVSTSPSPTHIYPVDSKFASPSSYETKMATKQSLASMPHQYQEDYRMNNTPIPITYSPRQILSKPSQNITAPPSSMYPFPNRPPPTNVYHPPPGVGEAMPPRYSTGGHNYGNGWQGGHRGVQGAYYMGTRENGGRWTF